MSLTKTPLKQDDTQRFSAPLIQLTSQVLGELLSFKNPADAVLSRFFKEHKETGQRDRAFIAEHAFDVLRHLRGAKRFAGARATPRQLLLAWWVRGAGVAVRRLEGAIKSEEFKILGELKGQTLPSITLGEQCEMPDWLVEQLLAQMPQADLLALALSLNQPAPLDLRVNTLKTNREAALLALQAEGMEAQPTPYSPLGLRMQGKPSVNRGELFKTGAIEVQDEGSQLLAYLVQPKRSEFVVDFCAGAGGKTLALGAMMRSTGRLYAMDVSEGRLIKLKGRMSRAGLSNVHPTLLANERDAKLKRMLGKADRVLVDAPCTGLGTLRRNPDLKWRQSPEAVLEMSAKQLAILTAAARLVRPGGRLVYATCSILKAENDDVVDAFLAAHPDFSAEHAGEILASQGIEGLEAQARLNLSPLAQGTDAFFAAVFVKRSA